MYRVRLWLAGRCALYAVERDGVCLADDFFALLSEKHEGDAVRLARFVEMYVNEEVLREVHLRPELPHEGVYAMYNHRQLLRENYNPSRLLCSYLHGYNSILVVGGGFIKQRTEPIQSNQEAMMLARELSSIMSVVNQRLAFGQLRVENRRLVATSVEALIIHHTGEINL